ncbi:[Protein-PII] uridylyltransferase [Saliniradius amylolyticus]|uniref:Bifunctional uridylyltransferase/uridylyl-removing enzyme n=1 Tax=Saliniradius amylolyticus TaxID=2183582 RepID=A0A2S2E4N7_9ALTE|nr:[protein-PII] uridylyltransferase [Saliniradius amylolyticus]AWL12614.1 [Protein-PII] uridylyltransferase [Saliniradius amylolyticus]
MHSLLSQIKQINVADNTAAFKACVENSYQWLEENAGMMEIESLVTGRATFVDTLLRQAWKLRGLHERKELALIAVGGYGRGQLQPYSDVDLLILTRRTPDKALQEALTEFVTFLWDIGLDIGQSVRTVNQTLKLAKDDVTIATNLIEARRLIGCEETFNALQIKMQGDKVWSSKAFFLAKLEEQQRRHARFNGTAYNLEPNIKENPGCLRDIQTIGWVAKKHFSVLKGQELVEHGYFTEREFTELKDCRNHLWRMRFTLHLVAGRSENRLLFDYQPEVAERLGYGDQGKASVEKMMKAFFRQLTRITELSEMLLQRFSHDTLNTKIKRTEVIDDDFELTDGLLHARHDEVFPDPESLLDFLRVIADTPQVIGLHSNTLRLLRQARRRFRRIPLTEHPSCRERFMALMAHPDFFGLAWDMAHKHGIMHAYLPEWNQIVGMMQFDLFHAYTVDEHTHRLVKHIYRYTLPDAVKTFPRCHRIMQEMDDPQILYIAAIFHDIGKGRGGDHSKLGAADLARFCQQHGIGQKETALAVWLVENHLLMSVTAQRRDIYDPDVIREFAAKVRSVDYLDHLYVLTLADIRATNDNLWNDWKASLLRELYMMTKKAIETGEEYHIDMQAQSQKHQQDALLRLQDSHIDDDLVHQFWHRLDEHYFIRFKPRQLVWHAQMIAEHQQLEGREMVVAFNDNTSKAGTELILYTRNRPSLFAQVASVLDSRNCSIHDAQIMTIDDGYVFDSFIILDDDGERIASPSRQRSLIEAIRTQLLKTSDQHTNNRKMSRRMKQLNVPTKMRFFTNKNDMTILELEALDAPGLLATISQEFICQDIHLHMAKISTIGERAEDVFLLTNHLDQALSQHQQLSLKNALTSLLDQHNNGETCHN